jgi:collagenase-like PrtC family protease
MKFQIGYQNHRAFISYLKNHIDCVSEIYFPWTNLTTGRGVVSNEEEAYLYEDIKEFASLGVRLSLLLNGNCYGSIALTKDFYLKLKQTVSFLIEEFSITGITTASVIIAQELKKEFPQLEIKASVNMEIGTIEGVEYLLDSFDSFYLKREYNYNLEVITRLKDFCHNNGKKLYILGNSGCLNYCSARTFHDNLVSHQHEIDNLDKTINFTGHCTSFLSKNENKKYLLSKSNFIRPEDINLYENLCDGIKLATRTNFNPLGIVHAYFNSKFSGNLLDLTEPAHSALFPGQILANKLIPNNYANFRFACDKKCEQCNFCKETLEKSIITL